MSIRDLPIVTVFGAGIAGLTAAHELVERGFKVQVVEPENDDLQEYECAVGGLAANQFSRVRAPIEVLHPALEAEGTLSIVRAWRVGILEGTYPRFPLCQRIRFNKGKHGPKGVAVADGVPPTPYEPRDAVPEWLDYWDGHGVTNRRKLADVLDTIRRAARFYMQIHFPELAKRLAAGMLPTDADWESGVLSPVVGDASATRTFVTRETLLVQVIGFTDTDGLAEDNRALAAKWAQDVRQALIDLNNAGPADLCIWNLEEHLEVVVQGSAEPRYDQATAIGRKKSNRVEFDIVEQDIPGEHGFRFFPNFYRHLFDTMKRTPILDAHGVPTGASAYDQLVPTPGALLALDDGKAPHFVNLRKFQSIYQIDEARKLFCERLKFRPRDILGLQYFTLRYLLSCADRRRETEEINFIEYVGGDQTDRYSDAALAFINKAPRALAAMSATESDARTQLDVASQLMALHPTRDFVADMTLNGPTSTAWLAHWKRYLQKQGVTFFVGRLKSLELLGDRVVPKAQGPADWELPLPEDPYCLYRAPTAADVSEHRFVLAVSFQHAVNLLAGRSRWQTVETQFTGPFAQLLSFGRLLGRRPGNGVSLGTAGPDRDPVTGKPPADYPLRTISGLQYFFQNDYRFGHGNAYFVSAPWGLTSISQFAYWRQRTRPVGELLGQISVDVGDWHASYPNQPPSQLGHTAWNSSCREIAEKTWDQIKGGLEQEYARQIAAPRYFHIDRNIVFGETIHSGFGGSVTFRVVSAPIPVSPAPIIRLAFAWTLDDWSRFGAAERVVRELKFAVSVPFDPHNLANELIKGINSDGGEYLFAVHDDDSLASEFMIAPKAFADRFVISFRSDVESKGFVTVNNEVEVFQLPGPNVRKRASELGRVVATLSDKTDLRLVVRRLAADGSTFELFSSDGQKFRASVANRHGALELLDGPGVEVYTNSRALQIVRPAFPPSGRVTRGAVRANAVVNFEQQENLTGAQPVQPGRLYRLIVQVGNVRKAFSHECNVDETAAVVRDKLLSALSPDLVLARPVDRGGTTGIMVSPVVTVKMARVRILGMSNQPFEIMINGNLLAEARSLASLTVTEIREALLEQIQARYGLVVDEAGSDGALVIERVGEDSLALTVPPNAPRGTFINIAVHNLDRQIELVDAEPVVVESKDIPILEPEEGFVPLRNDAEFLINIPKQWSGRPGLCRDLPQGVPTDYQKLLGFDLDQHPVEIFYGHSNAPSLKNWVAAGTYMATYTRMTTMEAANESGRHAAAALIYSEGQGGSLVADLPEIWDIEEFEPDDFKYYKKLDQELVKQGLPHALDILSISALVNALLDSKLSEQEIDQYLRDSFDTLKKAALLGVRGGQAFSKLLDEYRDLVSALFGEVTGVDPISRLERDYLRRVQDAADYFRHLWFD